MPRFMPVPKLAVAPVSEPSEPILMVAPPAPCVAYSAHDKVPVAPAAGLAAAGAVVAAAAGAAAVVGCAGGGAEHAATIRASAPRAASSARRRGTRIG